jgi:hypothetical protein
MRSLDFSIDAGMKTAENNTNARKPEVYELLGRRYEILTQNKFRVYSHKYTEHMKKSLFFNFKPLSISAKYVLVRQTHAGQIKNSGDISKTEMNGLLLQNTCTCKCISNKTGANKAMKEQNRSIDRGSCVPVFRMTQLNQKEQVQPSSLHRLCNSSDKVNTNKRHNILGIKGFPQHLKRAIESMYVETNIVIDNEGQRDKNKTIN